MAEGNNTLDTFYTNWKLYQDLLEQAIAPLTGEQLALRVAPEQRTIGELAGHIIAARAGWFSGFLGEDIGELTAMRDWDMTGAAPRSADELVRGLQATWEMLADYLGRWSSADMEHVISKERQGKTASLPRSWVIWHLIEHDIHHGGELSLMLGAHGLAAPDM